MSADGPVMPRGTLAALLFGVAALPSLAADEPLPDMAFIEYLGSWEGTDEDWEWLADESSDDDGQDERSEPAGADDTSRESDHEG